MSHQRDAMSVQLEDLVHRNRTLDQTIKRLQQELEREQERGKDAVAAVNSRWRTGCDTLLACHTIAHLRTTLSLEAERLSVLKCADDARLQQVARLQRDYRLTLFQIRESELETRISELEEELGDLTARNESALQKTATQHAHLAAQLEAKHDALQAAHDVKDELQV
jgi:hypothetical protein